MLIHSVREHLPSPRVLFSIDYESWFALSRRYDYLLNAQRRELDGEIALHAIDPILDMLGNAKSSFYLVGEIADWYPEVPRKIAAAGHELGFHCQVHRSLISLNDIKKDIQSSVGWRKQYNVRGYRAPMLRIVEDAYPILAEAGFQYSSSIYAPSGNLLQKESLLELPVSTLRLFGRQGDALSAPRHFTWNLLSKGEIPYGSSFMIGLMGKTILKILEKELRAGLSPVIILHPYEIIRPSHWPVRLRPDLLSDPLLWPFTLDKSAFLKALLQNFPISPLATYIDEALAMRAAHA